MSTERDVASLLRSWFRSEQDGTVDHVVDAILARVDTTAQRRATWWPERRPIMSYILKFGIAAAVLAMTVAIGYGLWQNIGNLNPVPQPSDDASSRAGEVPPILDDIFIGEPHEVPGIAAGDRLVLDFSNGIAVLHTAVGKTALASGAGITADGDLRLETVADATGCERGDIGTYAYSFSPGETTLTLELRDDDCDTRAAVVPGEWRRSACQAPDNWCLGPLEAGRQTSLFFDPFATDFGSPIARYGAMTYEVPQGWANADDRTHFYTLLRADTYAEEDPANCLDCPDGVWIGASPQASRLDCTDTPDEAVGTSAQALADWVRGHPGLTVTDGPSVSVDGRATTVLDISGAEAYADACLDPEHEVTFVPLFSHPGYDFAIRTGDRHRLLLVEVDDDRAMVIAIDSLDPGDLNALTAEIQPIIESIRLTAP